MVVQRADGPTAPFHAFISAMAGLGQSLASQSNAGEAGSASEPVLTLPRATIAKRRRSGKIARLTSRRRTRSRRALIAIPAGAKSVPTDPESNRQLLTTITSWCGTRLPDLAK